MWDRHISPIHSFFFLNFKETAFLHPAQSGKWHCLDKSSTEAYPTVGARKQGKKEKKQQQKSGFSLKVA